MGIFNRKNITGTNESSLLEAKLKPIPTTEQDLPAAKVVATVSVGGNFYQTNPNQNPITYGANNIFGRKTFDSNKYDFASTVGKGNYEPIASNTFLWNLISYFQDYYLSKYEYKGVEWTKFDTKYLESRLYWQGAVVVFKLTDKYYSLPFTIEQFDEIMMPKVVKPIWPNKDIESKSLTIGKDAVLFMANYNSFLQANLWMFGKLYQIWGRFLELNQLWVEIENNILLNNDRILVPTTSTNDDMWIQFLQAFFSGNPVLPIDPNSFDINKLKGWMDAKGLKVEFTDRTEHLWTNFYNKMELTKQFASINGNDAPDKKERIVSAEIIAGNTMTKGGELTAFEFRQRSVEEFNRVFGENLTIKMREEEITENDKGEVEESTVGENNE